MDKIELFFDENNIEFIIHDNKYVVNKEIFAAIAFKIMTLHSFATGNKFKKININNKKDIIEIAEKFNLNEEFFCEAQKIKN